MKTIIALLSMLVALPAFALENTRANREEQAVRYFRAVSLDDMVNGIVEATVAALPKEEQREARAELRKEVNPDALVRQAKSVITNCLTADELKALADFYSSRVGKSAMEKGTRCMNDLMAREMQRAVERAE